jgi:hypothetical protein
MKIIVKMKYGSHLYGLETSTSDEDYKGVFLPDINDIFLGKIPKSISENVKNSTSLKNESGDIDCEYYSLHNFLDMCCDGNTMALDMLHAPQESILISTPIWKYIQDNRSSFYTKKLNSYLGYAKGQVVKYGDKGGRYKSASILKDFLQEYKSNNMQDRKLMEIWSILPTDKNLKFVTIPVPYIGNREYYEVCGRKFEQNLNLLMFYNSVCGIVGGYGDRAKKSMKGVDWKAVSHAVRVSLQLEELYTEGTITFPFTGEKKDLLMKIKTGQMNFETEVSPLIENLFNEIEILSEYSEFPEKVDRKYWNKYIIQEVKNYVVNGLHF